MKYKSIFNVCLLTAFLLTATTSCDDWTEMEIHETDVNGAQEQNPEQYSVYTQNIRAYKATKHAVVYARLDNAPDKATSEKFFLRSLPDSIDIVSMRNADRLTDFDREDMAMVRADYGTRVLYYVDCTPGDKQNAAIASAAEAVRAGTFDGITLASSVPVDAATLQSLADALGQTPCLLIFEGTPSLLPEAQRGLFSYFVLDISAASDEYDIETEVRLATGYGNTAAGHLLLAVTPEGTLTDYNGVTRSAIAGAAYSALNMETPLGGIAIYNISDDYYDADIIYKQTRGGIQFLNPASVH